MPAHRSPGHQVRAHLLRHKDDGGRTGGSFEGAGLQLRQAARRYFPGDARTRGGQISQARLRVPRRDGCGGARPRRGRHRGRLQLRPAAGRRGLCAPHRPHRARRAQWAGDHVCRGPRDLEDAADHPLHEGQGAARARAHRGGSGTKAHERVSRDVARDVGKGRIQAAGRRDRSTPGPGIRRDRHRQRPPPFARRRQARAATGDRRRSSHAASNRATNRANIQNTRRARRGRARNRTPPRSGTKGPRARRGGSRQRFRTSRA